jgi:Uma2 family endonuclease
MAETDTHRTMMIDLLTALDEYFQDDPMVYVSGNIFLYYRDEANALQSISPDILVVRGVEKKIRRIYNMDVERKAPDVVIELTSISTKMEDLGNKRFTYAHLGVKEYFIFDPLSETVGPALRGYRLEGGEYASLPATRMTSEVLELDLKVEDGWLRLFNRKTGKRLLTYHEAAEARQAAELKAEEQSTARKAAEAKAAQESAARHAAEAEVLQLREELAKYRTSQKQ